SQPIDPSTGAPLSCVKQLFTNLDVRLISAARYNTCMQPMSPVPVASSELRVLVVDDDAELCQLLTEYLAGEGYAVECVHTGHRGIERALEGDYAIIVLDVMLPDLKGFEVLRRVRAQ